MPQQVSTKFITNLSDIQWDNLTDQVITHRDEALASRGEFDLRHADRYRRYLADPSLRPPGPWPEAARLFVPNTRNVFEKLQSEIWASLFGNMHQIQVTPFGDEDVMKTDFATRFLRWSLGKPLSIANPGGFAQVSADLLFDALLDSVGVAKITQWNPPWRAPSEDARRFLKRLVRIDALDLGMLLVAPDAEGLQYPQCRYVHQEFFLSSDDLLRMEHAGFDVPDYDELGYSQQMTDRKRAELERGGERVVEFKPDTIPFVESYERFVLDEDAGDEEDVIVSWFPDAQVAGTSHSSSGNHGRIAGIRRLIDVFPQDDRPRRPFFPVTVWPQPRQWKGMNVPDRLESMQDLINRLHEQLVNYGDVSMLPYVFVNTFLTGELPDLRTVRPGSTVPIDDINGVQFAPTRSLNRHFSEQIQLAQANVERDSQVSDMTLGRSSDRPNMPRTAAATMAILGEARKSYGSLVRHAALQFGEMLTFHFKLWQEILPDDTYVQVFEAGTMPSEESSTMWDRLFSREPLSETGRPSKEKYVALPIGRDNLSGFFDATIEVNPEEQFDRQVMLSLFQTTAPVIQEYPLGVRLMLKRMWASFDQHGFDDIYPEEIALLQTQQRTMAVEVQIAQFEMQLKQIGQAEAQQKLQAIQGAAAEYQKTGKIPPELADFMYEHSQQPQEQGQE